MLLCVCMWLSQELCENPTSYQKCWTHPPVHKPTTLFETLPWLSFSLLIVFSNSLPPHFLSRVFTLKIVDSRGYMSLSIFALRPPTTNLHKETSLRQFNAVMLKIKSFFFSDNRAIGLMSRVFTNGPGDRGSILGWVIPKIQKMVLDTALLNNQHYKVSIKGKEEQSREWSSALH